MIAKRRSFVTLISYQAPPLKKSGLYGEYQELKETIAEYRESLQSAPERSQDLLEQIGRFVSRCHLEYAGESTDKNLPESDLDKIESCLYTYENSLSTEGLHTINEDEIRGLFHALDGGYMPVGTAGDVIKNPDILPTGRNRVQFDPHLVPTRTAYERGAKAAKLSLERYLEQTGEYPQTMAVILWGLETSRSQGETIGQILYYLGLRLKTDKASYDDRLEVIPEEELDRPRVDVVIHICGFFRDMYPNLVRNLNEMLQKLLHSGEAEEKNFFLKHTRMLAEELRLENEKNKTTMRENEVWELASCRIFGPKEGEYGTRLTEVVRKGDWKEASELGTSFVEDLSFAYSAGSQGIKADQLLKWQYRQVESMSQVRKNVEYELTDLDHYYEFYGGLAKAIENEKGSKPVMLVADTTGKEVRVQNIQEALQQGIVTRLCNPKWIEGMMQHEYHGVSQIAKRFENVMGFAASTEAIESSTFSDLTRCYAVNEELRHRMQKSNRWGYMKMMERMKEAIILNLIDPSLGGVLIRGQKGTAKTTAVRAIPGLMKEMRVVEIPANATEDRVAGTIDVEAALKNGEKKFEPGLLAEADGNILYVDEINLLDDHIVDLLLDAAATGMNTVEREGISYSHTSKFVMIGSMNPEEGNLRPQLLDRFGMVVDVQAETDVDRRVEIIEKRLSYEKNPQSFCRKYAGAQKELREMICAARELLPEVKVGKEFLRLSAEICIECGTDGHRADIGMIKTARTLAALSGRKKVQREDIEKAAYYVLPHRMRKNPLDSGNLDQNAIEQILGRKREQGNQKEPKCTKEGD